jgi:hypothetical protein
MPADPEEVPSHTGYPPGTPETFNITPDKTLLPQSPQYIPPEDQPSGTEARSLQVVSTAPIGK